MLGVQRIQSRRTELASDENEITLTLNIAHCSLASCHRYLSPCFSLVFVLLFALKIEFARIIRSLLCVERVEKDTKFLLLPI